VPRHAPPTVRADASTPVHVLVKAPEGGLDADSVILGEQVRVLDKKRLLRPREELTPATMSRLNEALRIAFDLD
jgi:mRNA-degrading endonuclease toxin of MazEF toxin-antitoxin module